MLALDIGPDTPWQWKRPKGRPLDLRCQWPMWLLKQPSHQLRHPRPTVFTELQKPTSSHEGTGLHAAKANSSCDPSSVCFRLHPAERLYTLPGAGSNSKGPSSSKQYEIHAMLSSAADGSLEDHSMMRKNPRCLPKGTTEDSRHPARELASCFDHARREQRIPSSPVLRTCLQRTACFITGYILCSELKKVQQPHGLGE